MTARVEDMLTQVAVFTDEAGKKRLFSREGATDDADTSSLKNFQDVFLFPDEKSLPDLPKDGDIVAVGSTREHSRLYVAEEGDWVASRE